MSPGVAWLIVSLLVFDTAINLSFAVRAIVVAYQHRKPRAHQMTVKTQNMKVQMRVTSTSEIEPSRLIHQLAEYFAEAAARITVDDDDDSDDSDDDDDSVKH